MALYRGLTLGILFLGFMVITPSYGSTSCSFTPVHNQSFVNKVYQYFDEDSDVTIVEYVIKFNGTTPFDWSRYSDDERFQPWRWFRTQGSDSSRLLLAFYYYYGIFKDYLIETREIAVTLNVEPTGCLENIGKGELDVLLRNYLLRDFDINPKTVRHPYSVSDDVSICSMQLDDVDGWGRLTYRCCQYDDDGGDDTETKECEEIYNDSWVWALRALVIIFTILVFLYLPSFIPKRHRRHTYDYSPLDDIDFDLVVTSHPENFKNAKNSLVIQPETWQHMNAFKTEVRKLQKEMIYTAHVKHVTCQVSLYHIARKNYSPVSFSRALYDVLVLCKIRHKSPVDECCNTPICGELCCGGTCCPPWHVWLRGLRVVIIMAIICLPALPLFYAMTADDLEYQKLDEALKDRDLHKSFDFYAGKVFSRIIVGIISSMYILHTFILVLDGATDGRLTRLYSTVSEVSQKKSDLKYKLLRSRVIVKITLQHLQKYGIYFLPIWLLGLAFLPMVLVVLFIANSPMVKILTHTTKRLLARLNIISRSDVEPDEKFITFCKTFWFFISLVFVCIVLTIGINFIIHMVAVIIVEIVNDATVVYQILPVVLFLLFYVRDTFCRVEEKYKNYLHTILDSLIDKDHEELVKETQKAWPLEKNTMFQFTEEQCQQDSQNKGNNSFAPLFKVCHQTLRIRLKRVVLFLSKTEVLSTSKKFLFQTCDMETFGRPGRLVESFLLACFDFMKIAAFLLFVFMAVMAYGSIYSISPTNHLFITLVTGIIPLVLKNLFPTSDDTVDPMSFRYKSQLNQQIKSFAQSWELEDLIIETSNPKAVENEAINVPNSKLMRSERMAEFRQKPTKPIISTLILDMSEGGQHATPKQRRRSEDFKRNTSGKRSAQVGSSNICCGGETGEDIDYVDHNKKKPKGILKTTIRNDNHKEKRVNMNDQHWKEDESSKYELSNAGKWKGKKKTLPTLESPPEAETREFGLQEPGKQSQQVSDVRYQELKNNVPERPKVKRHDSSKDFRRFTAPPSSWGGASPSLSYDQKS